MASIAENNKNNILAEVKSLPSIPGVAGKLLTLLNEPDVTIVQIEDKLRYDPGLTTNILKLANSSYFGFSSKIGSIRQAIILLGTRKLVQIVMASCMNALLNKPILGYDLSPGELWRHSIAVSVAAEGLVKMLNHNNADIVFTAALLHDVGKLILGDYVNNSIEDIEKIASEGISFEAAVKTVIGTDHSEIGAKLLEKWSFPNEILEVVRWHHYPEIIKSNNIFIDIVHIANIICMMMGIGAGREELQLEISQYSVKRLGLKKEHIEIIASNIIQRVSEINSIFYNA